MDFDEAIKKTVEEFKNGIPVLFRYQTLVALIDALKKELPNAELEYELEIQKMLARMHDMVDKSELN